MNNVFKIIFSKAQQKLIVVSELAKGRGKSQSSGQTSSSQKKQNSSNIFKFIKTILALAIAQFVAMPVLAAEVATTGNHNIYVGSVKKDSKTPTKEGGEQNSIWNVVIGQDGGTQANSDFSVVIGNNAKGNANAAGVEPGGQIAIGYKAYAGYEANSGEDGAGAIAIGKNSKAIGHVSMALGEQAQATHYSSVALGYTAQSTGADTVAIGMATISSGAQATSIGKNAHAEGTGSIAAGTSANASGDQSTAMGKGSQATKDATVAVGKDSKATGRWTTATGAGSNASQDAATANGVNATASGEFSTSVGGNSQATANNATALGGKSQAIGESSTAIGSNSKAEAVNSTALGQGAQVSQNAENGLALGKGARVESVGSIALGSDSVANGTTAGNTANKLTIGDLNFTGPDDSNFAGAVANRQDTTVGQVVSVGSTGHERRVVNVASGELTASSTDAINGSQLYAVAEKVSDNFSAIKNKLDKSAIHLIKGTGLAKVDQEDITKGVVTVNVDETAVKKEVQSGLTEGSNIKLTKDTKTGNTTIATAKNVSFDKVTVGNVVTDGDKNEITGLANTTYNKTTTGVGDRASIAATEGQLQALADKDLSNITNGGQTVIKNLAKQAVKVVNGQNTTVTEGAEGDVKTFAVNVDLSSVAKKTDLQDYAKKDASNIAGNDKTAWENKLGDGTVAADSNGLVKGKTLYNETRVAQDGNYIKQANSAAENLKALDGKIKGNADDIAGNTTSIHNLGDRITANEGNITQNAGDITNLQNTKLDKNAIHKIKGTGLATVAQEDITTGDVVVNVDEAKVKKVAQNAIAAGDNITITDGTGDDLGKKVIATAKDVNFDKVTVGKVVTDQETNNIKGLANTTYEKNKTGVGDRASIAATEGQLKGLQESIGTEMANQQIAYKANNGNQEHVALSKGFDFTEVANETKVTADNAGKITIGLADSFKQKVNKMDERAVKYDLNSDGTVNKDSASLEGKNGTAIANVKSAIADQAGTTFRDKLTAAQGDSKTAKNAVNVSDLKSLADETADKNLSNITNDGETVIKNLAKNAVKVVDGTNTTVTPGTDGDATTYAVNVTTNGKILDNNTGIVTGGTVKTALDDLTLAYKANGKDGKTVKLSKGLNFVNGTNTTTEINENGVVKVNVSDKAIKDVVNTEYLKKDGTNIGDEAAKATFGENVGTGDLTTDGNTTKLVQAKAVKTYVDNASSTINNRIDNQVINITADGANPKQTIKLSDGLNFQGGTYTTATADANGNVTFDISPEKAKEFEIVSRETVTNKDDYITIESTPATKGANNREFKVGLDLTNLKGELDKSYIQHWTAQVNGSEVKQIGNNDVLNFVNGDNILITDDSGKIKVSTSMSPSFTDVTVGDTKIENAGITIANGPSMKVDGINAGGKNISNVLKGTADEDAVNVKQLKDAINAVQSNIGDVKTKVDSNHAVMYTDKKGDIVIPIAQEDGTLKYYKKSDFGTDGELVEGSSEVPSSELQARVINPDKENSHTPTILGNVGSSIDKQIADADAKQTNDADKIIHDGMSETAKAQAKVKYLTEENTTDNEAGYKVANVDDVKSLAVAGLDFVGNDEDVLHRNLGQKVAVVGEGVDKTASKSFQSASGNINVVKGSEGLTVKLNKDLQNMDSIGHKDGAKITLGDNNLQLGDKDNNPIVINGVKAGTADTDAVNKKQLDAQQIVYQANGQNKQSVLLSDGLNFVNGTSTVATVNDKGQVTFDVSATAKAKFEAKSREKVVAGTDNTAITVTADKKDGDDNRTFTVSLDKTNTVALLGDTFLKVDGSNIGTNQATFGDNVGATAITDVDGDQTKLVQMQAVKKYVGDEIANNQTNINNALNGKTFGLEDKDGNKATKTLDNTIKVLGDDNVKVVADAKKGEVTISMNEDINLGGKDGKDGSIGINGKDGKSGVAINGTDGISIKGKDGENGVTIAGVNGKDGTEGRIGLTGPAGKNGEQVKADIHVKEGKPVIDGTDGITRIVYDDKDDNEHQIATMDDGLKFGANSGKTNPVANKLGSKVTIKGSGDKADEKYSSASIKTKVTQGADGNTEIEVMLDKELALNKVTVGKDGKDGKDGVDGEIGVNGKNGVNGVTITATGEQGADGKDGANGHIGVNGVDGKSGVAIDGKDGISIAGKDGKNGVTIKGIDGANGTEGHIGLTGPAGKDGQQVTADIHVKEGKAGLTGTDGVDGITRIVYQDKDGNEHQVATFDDGLKFAGNDELVVNRHLNTKLTLTGEGVTKAALTSFQSAAGNIAVVQNAGKDGLEIKLNKDLQNIQSFSNGENGAKVTLGTDKNVTLNGGQIKGIAEGSENTDAVNKGQLDKAIANVTTEAGKHTEVTGSGNISVTDTAKAGEGHKYQVTVADDGTIASNDTKLVTGKTVFNETRVTKDGNYIKAANSAAKNLEALDGKVKENADNITKNSEAITNITNNKLDKSSIHEIKGSGLATVDQGDITTGDVTVNVDATAVKKAAQDAIKQGDNIVITKNKTTGETTIATAKDVNFDKVSVGTIVADKANNEIKGLANTTYNAQTGEGERASVAATEGQLKALADKTADNNLSNITETGKTVIKNLAKDSVKVVAGKNTTVTESTDGDAKTYAVNVDLSGVATKTELDSYAKKDASNIEGSSKTAWEDKLGDGKVDANSNGLVKGKTLFTETRVANDGNYIKADNSAAKNLKALDEKVKDNADKTLANEKEINNLGDRVTVNEGNIKNNTDSIAKNSKDINYLENTKLNKDAIHKVKGSNGIVIEQGGQVVDEGDITQGDLTIKCENCGDSEFERVNENTIKAKGDKPQHITNVAPGSVSETSTDAVNGSQLHAVNIKVNNLQDAVNKNRKEARAGSAASVAIASLPQAFRSGKSMVSAAMGSYKDQQAIAVGVSRISDNGKWIVKGSFSSDSQRNFATGVGVGFQW